jgi:DNA polymerase
VALKAAGKKAEQAPYKIILNATYGICKDPYSSAYDPRQANNVCVNGQLLLLDLLEHLEGHCELIQSNTDGLIIQIDDTDEAFDKVDDICFEWESRTGMSLGFDVITEIWQKDVNNYLFKFDNGEIERKGAYVKPLNNLDNDLPILNKAVVDYIVNGVPVEKTIGDCDDLKQFQKIVKVSKKYICGWHTKFKTVGTCKYRHDKGDARYHLYTCTHSKVHNPSTFGAMTFNACQCEGCPYFKSTAASVENIRLSDKTFRVFASNDPSDGFIGKQKTKNSTIEKFANTPDHCFIFNDNVNGVKVPEKLDRSYYITKAKERLEAFGVG